MLAIVIPYYKLTFFEETLQSLENQTDKRFKVYIGDDGSPEDPSLLIERYKGKFDFIYHRFNENIGKISLVKQWERCIDLIDKEEWIMILGDDDVLGKNVVVEFYNNLPEIKKEEINVIRFSTRIIDSEGQGVSVIFEHPKLEKASDSFWRRFKGKTRSSLSEYIFSRESQSRFGFKDYPLAWHSDDMAWLEFSDEKAILSINETFIEIRVSPESISGMKNNLIKKNRAEIQFFINLVRCKLQLFSKSERLELLYQVEVSIKKTRLLTHSEWFSLLIDYLCNFSIVPIIKFVRRYLVC